MICISLIKGPGNARSKYVTVLRQKEQLGNQHTRPAHSQECNPDLSAYSSVSKCKQTVLMFKKVFSDISFVFLLLANQALSAKGHL